MTRVVVRDYGSGNLRSAQRALERVGADGTVTADLEAALECDGLAVPGVGAFAACMAGLRAVGGDKLITRPLDLGAMNEAAARLLGEHDFAAFCRRREGATTVRALQRLHWERTCDGVAVGAVIADAFCHNMVRALVGALLPVGEGTRPPSWPSRVLATAVRDPTVRVVPPHGLSLEEVHYPEPGQLAARARVTRRVREGDPES